MLTLHDATRRVLLFFITRAECFVSIPFFLGVLILDGKLDKRRVELDGLLGDLQTEKSKLSKLMNRQLRAELEAEKKAFHLVSLA